MSAAIWLICLQAYADVKKRLVGAPTSGKISVVVTDIESYSGKSYDTGPP